MGVICAILTIWGAKYDTQNLNVQKHIQIREAVFKAVYYHLQHKLFFKTIFSKQVAGSADHQWTITTTFFVTMVFTETLSENLLSALSSLQLEFHLHQLLGRELIWAPKLRLCHHLMGALQDVPACTGVKNKGRTENMILQSFTHDTTKFLSSRTCTPIPLLPPSNE